MKKFIVFVLVAFIACSMVFAGAGNEKKSSEISNGNGTSEVVSTSEITTSTPVTGDIAPVSQEILNEQAGPEEGKTPVLSIQIPGVRIGYIYVEDIEDLMYYYYYNYAVEISAEDALNALIADELYAQGVIKNNLVLTDEQKQMLFDYQKGSIEQSLGQTLTSEQFDTLLTQYYGMTSEQFKEYLAKQYILNYYVTSAKASFFENIPEPTEEDAVAYLAENPTSFGEPEKVKLSHIFFSFGEDKDAAKAKADEALAAIKAGKTFEQAVVDYSEDTDSKTDGGAIGWLAVNDSTNLKYMGLNFFNGVFALNAGDVSEVIESNVGYHIVKVDVHTEWVYYGMDDVYSTDDDGCVTTVHDYIVSILPDVIYNKIFKEAYNSLISDLYQMATLVGFEEAVK